LPNPEKKPIGSNSLPWGWYGKMLNPIANTASTNRLDVSIAMDSRENRYNAATVKIMTAMAWGPGIGIGVID
jgi:hypothetical protein